MASHETVVASKDLNMEHEESTVMEVITRQCLVKRSLNACHSE
jgi:hypothetical protein